LNLAVIDLPKPEVPKPIPKKRPKVVLDAVALLAADTSEGKIGLGPLGQYLKRTDPAFSPQNYGHSGLLDMLRTCPQLQASQDGTVWSVSLKAKVE